ncbi:hypothetical protein JCM10207_003626 [Rhodosporidiobolus poonsookiae]
MSAVDVNPSRAAIHMTSTGSWVSWGFFGAFSLAALLLLGVCHARPVGQRAFHHLGVAVLVIASIEYYLQASNLVWTGVPVEWVRGGDLGADQVAAGAPYPPTRAVSYARYVDWTLSTLLLLLMLLLCTGFSLSRIFFALFWDVAMIVSGLISALIKTRYKWGIYVIGCACILNIVWTLLLPGRASAYSLGPEYGRVYFRSAFLLSALWLIYAGNVISVDNEVIAYGVLDFFTKVVWITFHLYGVETVDYTRFGFQSGKVSDGAMYAELAAPPTELATRSGPTSGGTASTFVGGSPAPGNGGAGSNSLKRKQPPAVTPMEMRPLSAAPGAGMPV